MSYRSPFIVIFYYIRHYSSCLLYTSDAADEARSVDRWCFRLLEYKRLSQSSVSTGS
ncbi:hypothetical protein PVA38_10305 [Streptococcus pneumoniae D39]|nr:hypothetical protein PVA38_10305 [Streptococcus pneumoniae D39]